MFNTDLGLTGGCNIMRSNCQLVNLFLGLCSRYATIRYIRSRVTRSLLYIRNRVTRSSLRSRVTQSSLYTEPSYAEFTVYGAELRGVYCIYFVLDFRILDWIDVSSDSGISIIHYRHLSDWLVLGGREREHPLSSICYIRNYSFFNRNPITNRCFPNYDFKREIKNISLRDAHFYFIIVITI